jgi:8-oxo-dGTP pyrophosphatase MutT (NUDIX family)
VLYLQEPPEFRLDFDAVGTFLEWRGMFLILRRHESRRYGGAWGLPAGLIEPGETALYAAAREVKEETGAGRSAAHVSRCLREHETVYVRDEVGDTRFALFSGRVGRWFVPKLRLDEHTGYRWVTPEMVLRIPRLIVGFPECVKLRYGLYAGGG